MIGHEVADSQRVTSKLLEDALEEALRRGEVGVQVAAYLNGELMANSWIGDACPEEGLAVNGDTLFPVFSVTKAVPSIALHLQAERGLVEYESPVSAYWPEFQANGKHEVTVAHLLTQRSGVPQMPEGATLDFAADWERVTQAISGLSLLYPPGTKSTYAALTYGWLTGEIVRRTDSSGRGFMGFVRDEVFEPLGIADFFVGLPIEQRSRVARLYASGDLRTSLPPLRTVAMPPAFEPGPTNWNVPTMQGACIPAASGIATADSVARLFSLLAMGGRARGRDLLSRQRVASFCSPRDRPHEVDDVLGMAPYIGLGGFFLGEESPPAEPIIGTSPTTLASNGAGGSIAWAELDSKLSVAICHNRLFPMSPPLEPQIHPFTQIGEAIRAMAGLPH